MIFSRIAGGVQTVEQFNLLAMEAFRFQLQRNRVYAEFVEALGIRPSAVTDHTRIPFLPIEFFRTREVYASDDEPGITFRSSGTTGMVRSRHGVADISLYRDSLLEAFRLFYGEPAGYVIAALTPSPEENPSSSLSFMIDRWIHAGALPGSGFYLKEPERLAELLRSAPQSPEGDLLHSVGSPKSPKGDLLHSVGAPKSPKGDFLPPHQGRVGEGRADGRVGEGPTLLIGLTYALLDLAEKYPIPLKGVTVMETGGMKGRRKEMVREEVHGILKDAFRVKEIHSEYGMTELLSQAYSTGQGRFRTPPWMKVLIREPNDPFAWTRQGRSGGISVIDLANWYSCPFIATQDLGRLHGDGSFEVLGRYDHSDLRGCNLMVSDW